MGFQYMDLIVVVEGDSYGSSWPEIDTSEQDRILYDGSGRL